MAPACRGFVAWLLFSALLGCESKPERPPIYQIRMIDYEVAFDGSQKRATIASGSFWIVRDPEDIRVSEGFLQVGNREYGAVSRGDKIAVVAGSVTVNNQERKPRSP